jgi:hypothetical protein
MTVPAVDDPEANWRDRVERIRRIHAGEFDDLSDVSPRLRAIATGRMIDAAMRAARQAETARGREDLEAAMARIVGSAPATLPIRFRPKPSMWDSTLDREVFWSPTPILGFRVWEVGTRLRGARKPWRTPTYDAECVRRGAGPHGDEIPHTDGSCGKPACGIYATKDPDPLLDYWGPGRAIGVVEMSGKVVEHDFGYRARRATAVFMVMSWAGGEEVASTPAEVTDMFADPQGWLDRRRKMGVLGAVPPVGPMLREAAERHRRSFV